MKGYLPPVPIGIKREENMLWYVVCAFLPPLAGPGWLPLWTVRGKIPKCFPKISPGAQEAEADAGGRSAAPRTWNENVHQREVIPSRSLQLSLPEGRVAALCLSFFFWKLITLGCSYPGQPLCPFCSSLFLFSPLITLWLFSVWQLSLLLEFLSWIQQMEFFLPLTMFSFSPFSFLSYSLIPASFFSLILSPFPSLWERLCCFVILIFISSSEPLPCLVWAPQNLCLEG